MGGFRSNIRFSTPRLNLLLACSILLLASTTGCSISKIRRSWSKDATRIESPQPENDEPAPIESDAEVHQDPEVDSEVVAIETDVAAEQEITRTAMNIAPEVAPPIEDSDSEEPLPQPQSTETEMAPPPESPREVLALEDVIDSVMRSYPLLQAELFGRNVALGNRISAEGSYDLKLKAASENGPMGYYQTYRNLAGIEQPLWMGGNAFAGYKLGRGTFQPWFYDRETNKGGEFKLGASVPLLQNRQIDERRTNLFNADWARQEVEPAIRTELIGFVYMASITYWDWVGAGRNLNVSQSILDLALMRREGLELRVERGDLERIELVDNQRLIVSREAKLVESRRKLEQTAAKLSLFFRDENDRPILPTEAMLPDELPPIEEPPESIPGEDLQLAYENRPEIQVYDFQLRQLDNEMALASNQKLPNLDAAIAASKDVGEPISYQKYKSPFELEAGLYFEVPAQRRKAGGKLIALEGKRAQIVAKRRFAEDKILAELQMAQAAIKAGHLRIRQARESAELANQMEQAERRKFDLGASNLMFVNTREQQSAEAQMTEVEATVEYYDAKAAYHAALGIDRLQE